MAVNQETVALPALPASLPRHRRRLPGLLRFARQKPLGAIGGLIVFFMLVLALFAGPIDIPNPVMGGTLLTVPVQIAPYGPEQQASLRRTPQAPNGQYWFGTDKFGQDQFSRILYGARLSLWIGFSTILLSSVLGALIGLVSGYLGGRVDETIQRILEMFLAFPALLLALTIVAMVGPGVNNVIIAITIVATPQFARVVRGSVLAAKHDQYVEAGRSIGASTPRLIFRHILPNIMAPLIVVATAGLGAVIVAESGLSFLGVGVPQGTASWGRMLNDSRASWENYPWLAIFPGIAISLAVYGFNLLGDALRDVLDPRLRR